MQRDGLVYLGHIFDTARLIVGKVNGKSRAEFDADENLRLALAHLIQTFGESARRVSTAFRESVPEIPWRSIREQQHCPI